MRGGGAGVSRGGQGVPGRVRGSPEVLGGKTAKNTKKSEKRSGAVWLGLRSNIQDFVQEVPVGQMVQGTPFRCMPWTVFYCCMATI